MKTDELVGESMLETLTELLSHVPKPSVRYTSTFVDEGQLLRFTNVSDHRVSFTVLGKTTLLKPEDSTEVLISDDEV
jgi:hypothetical protein